MNAVVVVALVLASFTTASSRNVTVSPSSPSCSSPCGSQAVNGTTIDQALENVTAGTNVLLLPGCHCVRTFNLVGNVTDVSLIGAGGGAVWITCAPGLGLAFFNVTRLSFYGLTVTGCGLNGSNVVMLNGVINNVVDFFTQLTENVTIATVIASCEAVTMDHVIITNTTGLGLLGVNVAGQSNFTNNVFSFNTDILCSVSVGNSLISNTVGGGASFIYADYVSDNLGNPVEFRINNNTFFHNTYCGGELLLQVYSQFTDEFRSRNYSIPSLGGLALSFSQRSYAVHVDIQRSTFENNAAASNVIWYAGSSESQTVFSDCAFTRNGNVKLAAGGSINLLKDVRNPSTRQSSVATTLGGNTLTVARTNFTQNVASIGSAFYAYSFYSKASSAADRFTLESSRFEKNVAATGAAVYVNEYKGHGFFEGLSATVRGCTFADNALDLFSSHSRTPSENDAVFQVSNINVTIEDCEFVSNNGTAVGATSSVVVFAGDVLFYNNSALAGAALYLASVALMVVRDNSHITFANNSAAFSGAAIYADYSFGQPIANQYSDCFLYFGTFDIVCTSEYLCLDLITSNITMTFAHNSAPLGSLIFGSNLETCPWAAPLRKQLNVSASSVVDYSIFQAMYDRSVIVRSDQSPNTTAAFSTPASALSVASTSASSAYMPGQQFTLTIRSADRLNRSVPTVVSTRPLDDLFPLLGDSGYWLTSATNNQMSATVKVRGQRNTMNNLQLYTVSTFVLSNAIPVNLTECLFGFEYAEQGGGDCRCSSATTASSVTCDENLKLFKVTKGWWIGPDRAGGNGVVYQPCVFDYCVTPAVAAVLPQAMDAQCANHRTGLLCGGCQEGYSAVLGTYRCMECTNNTLGLLVFFAFAGVGIIAILSFLHITVTDGYIDGILFYVSIVSSYEANLVGRLLGREVFIPIFLLNLDMGFETCFYNGMTQLARAGLSLVFPIYLFVLMLLFIWVASRSFKLSQLLANTSYTPSKLLATLITLSYNSIAESCFRLLGFIRVTVYQSDGSSHVAYRWNTDPNVEYFSPLHAVLFIICVVLLATFIIPVPILLTIPSFASCPLPKLKPLYDAFVFPLKDKFAFWIGIRFTLRLIYLIVSSFSEPPLDILLLGVGQVLAIFLNASVQPHKKDVHNVLHVFFICNILLLAIGDLYFQQSDDLGSGGELAYVLLVVGVAYGVIIIIMGKLILLRFPWLSEKFGTCCKRSLHSTYSTQGKSKDAVVLIQLANIRNAPEKPAAPAFAQLREPLMEA